LYYYKRTPYIYKRIEVCRRALKKHLLQNADRGYHLFPFGQQSGHSYVIYYILSLFHPRVNSKIAQTGTTGTIFYEKFLFYEKVAGTFEYFSNSQEY